MQQTKNTAYDLIRAARRDNNTKRPYLLVNPCQGKHVPVSPACSLSLFHSLGICVRERLREGGKVIVIAFAETATAIGAGIAESLPGEVWLMQTTREDLEGTDFLYFSEVHSHASEQRLAEAGLADVMQSVDTIIFAEDEVTTGRTIRNAIFALSKRMDLEGKRWMIASILNGMQEEDARYFQEHAIELLYLRKSNNLLEAEKLEKYAYEGARHPKGRQYPEKAVTFVRLEGCVNPRRVVRMADYKSACEKLAEETAKLLEVREDEELLVLGTEEFMYPAMRAAAFLQKEHKVSSVCFHATTRSPILTSQEEDYPLHERDELESVYQKERVTYVYDLKRYDQAVVITDAKIDRGGGIQTLLAALYRAGNEKITVIEWSGEAPGIQPAHSRMRSSYSTEDVDLLLKDITGQVKPQPTEERERLIQGGRHYCEMLPVEYAPSEAYLAAYEDALLQEAKATAEAVETVAELVMRERGRILVLVSLARAGIPIGILMKRYLDRQYGIKVPHYAISIIRGRGIDRNAMQYILDRHPASSLQFVDGWIGKGAILGELEKEMKNYPGVSPKLAVAADPAGLTDLCGTHEDILIPSSCLNSTVSGLISRTFLRSDIIGENDFHGAVYYEELKQQDRSYEFINAIERYVTFSEKRADTALSQVTGDETGPEYKAAITEDTGLAEVKELQKKYQVEQLSFIKPGIGEATRVLLRRAPWKVLVREEEKDSPMLRHLIRLAYEKDVPVEFVPLKHYRACGIIKKMADV